MRYIEEKKTTLEVTFNERNGLWK